MVSVFTPVKSWRNIELNPAACRKPGTESKTLSEDMPDPEESSLKEKQNKKRRFFSNETPGYVDRRTLT